LAPHLKISWQSYFDAILAIFTVTVTVHDNMAASFNQEKLFCSLIEGYKRCKPKLNRKVVQQDVAQEWQAMKAATKSNHNALSELMKLRQAIGCILKSRLSNL